MVLMGMDLCRCPYPCKTPGTHLLSPSYFCDN
jgi:hypothetical protein